VRSREPNALPLILTTAARLAAGVPEGDRPAHRPVAYGGRAKDLRRRNPAILAMAFRASRPILAGIRRVARAWDVLMKRLATPVTCRRWRSRLGHLRRTGAPGTPWTARHSYHNAGHDPREPSGGINTATRRRWADRPGAGGVQRTQHLLGRGAAYGAMMVTRPQTIGYALTDSPSAWPPSPTKRSPHGATATPSRERDRARRNTRRHHAVLAHGQWRIFVPLLLGKQQQQFSASAQKTNQIKVPVAIRCSRTRFIARRKAGRAGLSVAVLLPSSRQGRHFAAWDSRKSSVRAARSVQTAALIGPCGNAGTRCTCIPTFNRRC